MSTPTAVTNVAEQVIAGLAEATWDYLADIGWMEVILPGGSGRGGIAHLVGDDLYVRLDVESGDPLSVIIPAFDSWLAEQEGRALPPPEAPIDYAAARKRLEHVLRASPELAAR